MPAISAKKPIHLVRKVYDIGRKVIHGRKELSPSVQSILQEFGNEIITGIEIGRTPVNTLITGTLKVVSGIPYDKLFHLFIILQTNKGDILLEKNEVIHMQLNPHIGNAEYRQIHHVPQGLTINELLNRTEHRMKSNFLTYSAATNNCQHFILSILQANGIHESSDFIKQNTESIFDSRPTLRKFANTVTDVASKVNVLTEGGKIEINGSNNGLYSDEIVKILRNHGYYINGVYSKNKLPKELKQGWYVINLQSSNAGNGSHWTCFKVSQNDLWYNDSMGFPPPTEVIKKCKNNLYYNKKEIQDIHSTACGWFCIGAIVSDTGRSMYDFNKYINMFSNNTYNNDSILSKYLVSKGFS